MSNLAKLPQSNAVKFYTSIIEDVIANSREHFMDEGSDESTLSDLKQLWESKIITSKVLEPPEIEIEDDLQPPPLSECKPVVENKLLSVPTTSTPRKGNGTAQTKSKTAIVTAAAASLRTGSLVPMIPNKNLVLQNPISKVRAPTSVTSLPRQQLSQPQRQQAPIVTADLGKLVPVQLSFPPQAGSADKSPRIFQIQVPQSVLEPGQLQKILTTQIVTAALTLPKQIATTLLQQHIHTAMRSNVTQTTTQARAGNSSQMVNSSQLNHAKQNTTTTNNFKGVIKTVSKVQNINQIDGACCMSMDDELNTKIAEKNSNETTSTSNIDGRPYIEIRMNKKKVKKNIVQLDGIADSDDDDDLIEDNSSDEDDEDDDDDDEDDDDMNSEDEDMDDSSNGVEEDPLNSGDDVSEGDNSELFETDNIVVCQYDKIQRARNKWKLYLKDGIMNLAGRDFVFQKANGDAEW